jgi:hypothetical protein
LELTESPGSVERDKSELGWLSAGRFAADRLPSIRFEFISAAAIDSENIKRGHTPHRFHSEEIMSSERGEWQLADRHAAEIP